MWERIEPFVTMLFLLLGFIAVLAAAYGTSRMVGRQFTGSFGGSRHIRVLDRAVIGQDKLLCIVQIAEKVFVLGVTPHTVQTICELPPDAIAQEAPPVQNSFSGILGEAVQKFSGKKAQEKQGGEKHQ